MEHTRHKWSAADAKAHFAEVIDAAVHRRPQIITRHGKPVAVVMALTQWHDQENAARTENALEFFKKSPLWRSNLKIARARGRVRPVDF